MAVSFTGAHFPQELILTCIRWSVASPLSTRHVEERMRERGVPVDHATIHRWVIKSSPQLEEACHSRQRPVGRRWRMEETYMRVKGEWPRSFTWLRRGGRFVSTNRSGPS